ERGHDVVQDVFGKDVVWVPYRRPGFQLSKNVWAAIRAHPGTRGIVLEKHGLSTWGATLRDAYLATIDLVTRAEERLRDAARARPAARGGSRACPAGPPPPRSAAPAAPAGSPRSGAGCSGATGGWCCASTPARTPASWPAPPGRRGPRRSAPPRPTTPSTRSG